jgi:hypothetical protein
LIKVAAKKRANWTLRNLDQCISLSLSDIKKNEPMLKDACFFWSNTYNAFLFRQGPMSSTLADVHMLTGLNIAGHINPFGLLVKPSVELDNIRTRGSSQYIINHKSDNRSVCDREHTTFSKQVARQICLLWTSLFSNIQLPHPSRENIRQL